MEMPAFSEILMTHADGLNQGIDQTQQLVEQYSDIFPELPALLRLGLLLKQVLIPIKARPAFARQLRQQLLGEKIALSASVPASKRHIWIGAATVGSILSVTGVIFFVLHRTKLLTRSQPASFTPTV